jgi:hypothetical protein
MKQGEGPRADPEKTRAWQQRSREKAAKRAQERPRAPLQRVRLETRAGTAGDPSVPAERPWWSRVRFRAKRAARERWCFRCGTRRGDGWHHWLPQEHIRVHVRGLRLQEDEGTRVLKALLADERNLSAACHRCHMDGEHDVVDYFTMEEVPVEAHVFAAELGPEWAERLRRMYPAAGSAAATDGGL